MPHLTFLSKALLQLSFFVVRAYITSHRDHNQATAPFSSNGSENKMNSHSNRVFPLNRKQYKLTPTIEMYQFYYKDSQNSK